MAVDPKTLKRGDKVLLEVEFRELTDIDPYCVRVSYDHDRMSVRPSAIHSVLPRPLEAGDKVRNKTASGPGYLKHVGTLLHVHEGWAMVLFTEQPAVVPICDLERVS